VRCDGFHEIRPVIQTSFVVDNRRWLAGGVLLTFFSGSGQTYFVSLFAGEIRAAYGLSHGGFGAVYMIATLGSAVTLIGLGRVVDRHPTTRVASWVVVALACACLWMAISRSVVGLVVAIYALRLFGQGMMSHVAMTAMGRWFDATRGRAVSITSLGYQLGEGVLPVLVVFLLPLVDWRLVWVGAAALLVLVAWPLLRMFWAVSRTPQGSGGGAPERGRQWTRAEALRDRAFAPLLCAVLAPAFIGTSTFFHQVHLGEIKGWQASAFPSAFVLLALVTIVSGLASGRVIDALGACRLLPGFLLPLGVACAVLAIGETPATAWWFMALLGVSYGISSSVLGAVWPELYGTRHLGAIRAVVFAGMVFASALGPGLTGWAIDAGVGFERQLLYMAAYCLVAAGLMVPLARRLASRVRHGAPQVSAPAGPPVA